MEYIEPSNSRRAATNMGNRATRDKSLDRKRRDNSEMTYETKQDRRSKHDQTGDETRSDEIGGQTWDETKDKIGRRGKRGRPRWRADGKISIETYLNTGASDFSEVIEMRIYISGFGLPTAPASPICSHGPMISLSQISSVLYLVSHLLLPDLSFGSWPSVTWCTYRT